MAQCLCTPPKEEKAVRNAVHNLVERIDRANETLHRVAANDRLDPIPGICPMEVARRVDDGRTFGAYDAGRVTKRGGGRQCGLRNLLTDRFDAPKFDFESFELFGLGLIELLELGAIET